MMADSATLVGLTTAAFGAGAVVGGTLGAVLRASHERTERFRERMISIADEFLREVEEARHAVASYEDAVEDVIGFMEESAAADLETEHIQTLDDEAKAAELAAQAAVQASDDQKGGLGQDVPASEAGPSMRVDIPAQPAEAAALEAADAEDPLAQAYATAFARFDSVSEAVREAERVIPRLAVTFPAESTEAMDSAYPSVVALFNAIAVIARGLNEPPIDHHALGSALNDQTDAQYRFAAYANQVIWDPSLGRRGRRRKALVSRLHPHGDRMEPPGEHRPPVVG